MALLVATNSAFRGSVVSFKDLDSHLWENIELTDRPELLVIRLSQRTEDIDVVTKCLKNLYDKGFGSISEEIKESMRCWFQIDGVVHVFDVRSATWKKA